MKNHTRSKRLLPLFLFTVSLAISCQAPRDTWPVDITIAPLQSTLIRNETELASHIDSIEIIPIIDKSGNTLYNDTRKVILSDQKFLILSDRMLFSFDTEASEIRSYGALGRGPGEYTAIIDFCIDDTGKKLLCLVFPPAVLKYDLASHDYEGKIELSGDIVNPSGILPAPKGGFFLYVANPPDPERESLTQNFHCLKRFDSRGALKEELMLRTDFNLSGVVNPVFCTNGTVYTLSPGTLHIPCLMFRNGSIAQAYTFDFGDKTLPYRYAYRDHRDTWESIADIFQKDFFKLLSSLAPTDNGVFFSAFGENSQLWHFFTGRSGSIRWRAEPLITAPMKAVTADSTHIYFIYEDYGLLSPEEEKDPLKKCVLDAFGLPAEHNASVFVKVKFAAR